MPFPIPYTLIRANRKTVGIRILKDGTLQVRAPRYVPVAEIERVLHTKESWISEHRNRILSMKHTCWKYGSEIPYLGEPRVLTPGEENRVYLTDTAIIIPANLPEKSIPEAIIKLYISVGKPHLTAETLRLAGKFGLTVHSVTVNRAAKRWGSCTVQKGRIHYSWRLMCVPVEIAEYVIVHELVHLLHPDHSTAFWQQVENWMPNYEKRRAVLREYETYFMSLEGL